MRISKMGAGVALMAMCCATGCMSSRQEAGPAGSPQGGTDTARAASTSTAEAGQSTLTVPTPHTAQATPIPQPAPTATAPNLGQVERADQLVGQSVMTSDGQRSAKI